MKIYEFSLEQRKGRQDIKKYRFITPKKHQRTNSDSVCRQLNYKVAKILQHKSSNRLKKTPPETNSRSSLRSLRSARSKRLFHKKEPSLMIPDIIIQKPEQLKRSIVIKVPKEKAEGSLCVRIGTSHRYGVNSTRTGECQTDSEH